MQVHNFPAVVLIKSCVRCTAYTKKHAQLESDRKPSLPPVPETSQPRAHPFIMSGMRREAQLEECLVLTDKVIGSIPTGPMKISG